MRSKRGLVNRVVEGRKWLMVAATLGIATVASAAIIPNLFPFLDPTGVVSTYNVNGPLDESNPFFQSLGTNGRTCATCHVAGNAFGLSVPTVQKRFRETRGLDPLFSPNDGANCPNATPGDNPAEHSLLLNSGLIRIALQVPLNAQFKISAIRDPYGCAVVTDPTTGQQTVSVYRRPLPTANLRFLSTVMFDGRETIDPLNDKNTFPANLLTDLMHQAMDATTGHAQGLPPTEAVQKSIADFELGLSSAQAFDSRAGLLSTDGARGGALDLHQQYYQPGINDSLGGDPSGAKFNSAVFTIFDSWANLPEPRQPFNQSSIANRKKIAAGEALFNTRALTISDVRGLNDNSALGATPVPPFQGTCTTCHDTPNVGNHSFPLPLDIGTGHDSANESNPQIANGLSQLNLPDVPVYEITGCPNSFQQAGQPAEPFVIYTTDPGKALTSGFCSDVNRIKGPILRGLAARAPYFHNGAAQDLNALINFYNLRFQMNLTEEEKSEFVAFLNSL